jgi:WD40 repeat protein
MTPVDSSPAFHELDPSLAQAGVLASLGRGEPLFVGLSPGGVVYVGPGGACAIDAGTGALRWSYAADVLAGTHARSAPMLALVTPQRTLLVDTSDGRLVQSLEQPRAAAPVLALSDDGKTLAVADPGSAVEIWEVTRGDKIRELSGLKEVSVLRFRPDGRWLAGASKTGTFEVWSVEDGDDIGSLGLGFRRFFNHHARGVFDLAVGDTGLVATGDDVVKLWDMNSGTLRLEFPRPAEVRGGLAFADGDRLLLAGGLGGTIQLRDTSSGALLRTFGPHDDWVLGAFLTTDEKTLLSFSVNRTLKGWAFETGEEQRTLHFPAGNVSATVARARGESRVAVRVEGGIEVRTLAPPADPASEGPSRPDETGEVAGQIRLSQGFNHAVIRPGADQLAATADDGSLSMWGIKGGQHIRKFKGHDGRMIDVSFSPDGARLAGSDDQGVVLLWEAGSGQLLWKTQASSSGAPRLAFHPDGQRIASACARDVKIWALDGQIASTLSCGGDAQIVAWSPDGLLIATGDSHGLVAVWGAANGERRHAFRGHRTALRSLVFSRDGRALLSQDVSAVLRVWGLAP